MREFNHLKDLPGLERPNQAKQRTLLFFLIIIIIMETNFFFFFVSFGLAPSLGLKFQFRDLFLFLFLLLFFFETYVIVSEGEVVGN